METKGRTAFMKQELGKRLLSICVLHHRGRCRAMKSCRQLHVHPEVVDAFRDRVANSCCSFHSGSDLGSGAVVAVRLDSGSIVNTTANDFSWTRGLNELLKRGGSQCEVHEDRLCGLNKHKRCKWGERCLNLHLCREIDISRSPASTPEICPLTIESWTSGMDALCKFADQWTSQSS